MAEGLARHLALEVIEAISAGLSPLGMISMPTRAVLREYGIKIDGQFSKGLAEVNQLSADLIVNMTGIPGKALFPEGNVVDWEVEDPFGEDIAAYRRVFEEIRERVAEVAASLREDKPSAGPA